MANKQVRVGILSDTHGWLNPQVHEVLSDADCIVHAGDIMSTEVLATLESLAKVVAVAGNNDNDLLPVTAEVDLPGGRLVVTHGDQFGRQPCHDRLRHEWPQARVVVYGHTHQIVCDQQTLPWVLNPGAAGRVRVREGASCLMLTADADHWTVKTHQFAKEN